MNQLADNFYSPESGQCLVSNSDNAARPVETFAGQINKALDESMMGDSNVVIGGQLVRFGAAGMTTGLYDKYPERFITYSVSESLMTSSAMGLALAGKRVVQIHVRMDFLACGMDALVNHIPVWVRKGHKLPITFIVQIGKGMGQGAQHSKDLTHWFANFEGWNVVVPQTPQEAYHRLKRAIFLDTPTMYVIHRELFNAAEGKTIPMPDRVRLCGASQRHEAEYYGEQPAKVSTVQCFRGKCNRADCEVNGCEYGPPPVGNRYKHGD